MNRHEVGVRRSLLIFAMSLPFVGFASVPASSQDASAGAAVFARCAACHQVGPSAQNARGPVLSGVMGRPMASVPRFAYSNGLSARAGQPWNADLIATYIADPSGFIGMRSPMPAQRLRPDQVADLLAYLGTQ